MFEISFAFEIISFLTGLILIKNISPVVYRLIIPVLAITVINEGLSHYGFYKQSGIDKVIVYNLFFFFQFIIVGIIYLSILRNDKNSRTILFFFFSVIVTAVLFLIIKPVNRLNPDYITIMCGALIVLGFYYLYHIYSTGMANDLKSNSVLWFTFGMIIAQFLFLLFINALRIDSFRRDESSINVFKTLNTIGNFFYYLCIIYSFLCGLIFHRRVIT